MLNYEDYKKMGLHIDLSRGKPCKEQLDISMDMLNCTDYLADDGIDCRNYSGMDGVEAAKTLFSEIFECDNKEVFIGGNSSLNLIYSVINLGYIKGFLESCEPLFNVRNRKLLCPVPGYDRHFKIGEYFGFELIPIKMLETGPDMDMIEELVSKDESIKGIFCVPIYSNPDGYVYSDETVIRFAKLKPKAKDFKIFWDNAYMLHNFSGNEVKILNLLNEAKKFGNEDMVYMFFSTSKMTFPGGGVAAIACSEENVRYLKENFGISIICYDKLNQLRHVKFLKNLDNIKRVMKRHGEFIRPKFEVVFDILRENFGDNSEILRWTEPEGGYFLSLYLKPGYARRVINMCKEVGVILTGAGAAFPYGVDHKDWHIRFAPTYVSIEEVEVATRVLCCAVEEIVY